MLKRTTAAVAVVTLACAASAGGTRFNLIGTINASADPDCMGAPITTTTKFYHDIINFTNGGPPGALPSGSVYEDSYFAIDGFGPGNPADADVNAGPSVQGVKQATGAAGSACGISFTDTSTLDIGSAFAAPGFGMPSSSDWAGAGMYPGSEAIFFARLTTDGTVMAPEVHFNLDDQAGGFINVVINGLGVANAVNVPALGQTFSIINIQSESAFGNGTINDLYFTNVPAPGSAVALGVIGVFAARRRRG